LDDTSTPRPRSVDSPTFARIRALAVPAILANAAVPLLGLVDTAVIARVGEASDLGAVGLGALVFNSLYWSLGFLRMSTTGLVAQAWGASDEQAALVIVRAMLLAVVAGLAVWLLRAPLGELALTLLEPSPEVSSPLSAYIEARMWGAPGTLFTFVVSGALIGLGRMRALLALQLTLNGLNLAFDLFFVLGLGWKVQGLAYGTALAETLAALASAAVLARLDISFRSLWQRRQVLFERSALSGLWRVNGNLFVRTLALLTGFAWFSRQGAQLGDVVLASNHLLQQLVAFCAFFLDGIAFVAESFVGQAWGARDRGLFVLAVKRTSVVAAAVGVALSSLVWLLGAPLLGLLAPLPEVYATALHYLPFAAGYVLVAVAAWQLDGIFIGATCGRQLRDAALLSLGAFLLAANLLEARFGNAGLWTAMLVYVAARGATLAMFIPRLLAELTPPSAR
jgi:MATE family multidrug resistance protein